MSNSPPAGSQIIVDYLNGHQRIVIPHGNGGVMKYFIGAFLLFWLGGWFTGFVFALSKIASGEGGAFLIFWLGGWSIAGLFVGYMIYSVFRKSVPEQILLNQPSLSIDTGVPPLKLYFGFGLNGQKEHWKSLFPKRKKVEFSTSEIKTMSLRETDSSNRLTIDRGNERFELATSASEIEREWLHNYLSTNYF